MTAPGPTFKTFQKRLYTVLPRGVAVTRVRSNSASASSRSLHNYSPSLPYFDPSTPTPSSRPGNPHLLSTTRLPIEARTEPEAPNSGHSQHTHTGHAPPSSLALTSPHSSNPVSSSQNGIPLANFHAPPFFLYQPFTPPSLPSSAVLDSCSLPPHASTSKLRFHFDVGAYGIPKFRPSNVISGRDGVGGAEHWSHSSKPTEGLDLAVQVGEDAYFVRDNAMGVADGVGGWSRTRVLSVSFTHSRCIHPRSRCAERRSISFGALRPSSHALLFRRGSGTGFHPCCFFPRCTAVIKDHVLPLSGLVFAITPDHPGGPE
jgi:hypothetical protein